MKKLYWLLSFFMLMGLGYSQEKEDSATLLYISKTKIDPKFLGKVVYVLDSADLQKFKGQSVADALTTVPGIEINQSQGNYGATLSYYVRGGRNKNVLIIIDGLPAMDPSQIDQYFDLNLLSLELVESIEVLEGASSAIYGSSASAGVISITTKKSPKKLIAGNIGASGGSYDTYQQSINLGGAWRKIYYGVSANNYKSGGISAALGDGFEKDYGERQNAQVKLGMKPTKNIDLMFTGSFLNSYYHFDTGAFTDNIYLNASTTEYSYGLVAAWKNVKSGVFNIKSKAADYKRNTGFGVNHARNYFVDMTQTINLSRNINVLLGVDYNLQNNSIFNEQDSLIRSAGITEYHTLNPYIQLYYKLGNFSLLLNGRYNTHSVYSGRFVYGVSPSYLIKTKTGLDISLKGSIATAYIAPTLYQVYGDSQYVLPSAHIQPEDSYTVEGGVSFYYKKLFILNTTYFNRQDKNPIVYGNFNEFFQGSYSNQEGKYRTSGIELELRASPHKNVYLGSAYTYVNLDSNLDNRRIPAHKISSYLTINSIFKGNSISIKHQWVDKRADAYFDSDTFEIIAVELAPYHLLDIFMNQKITHKLSFYAALNNVFNSHYQQAAGFSTYGRNAMLGFNYAF